jgi:hypothetical protein
MARWKSNVELIQGFSDNQDNMAELGSGIPIHSGHADLLTSTDLWRMVTNLPLADNTAPTR